MKIINKTGKVVGIGSLTLLPDGSGELPVSFGNNPIRRQSGRRKPWPPPSRLPKKRRRKTLPLRLKAQQPR